MIEVARGETRLRSRSLALSSVAKCSIAVVIMPRYCGDFIASTLIGLLTQRALPAHSYPF